MILLDKILMGIILLMAGMMIFLMYRLVRKDPDLWLTPKIWDVPRLWCREVWSLFEKLQLKDNFGPLSRRKKSEEDQRRE